MRVMSKRNMFTPLESPVACLPSGRPAMGGGNKIPFEANTVCEPSSWKVKDFLTGFKLIVTCVVTCVLVLLFVSNAFSITAEISPNDIPVDSFYYGSKVVVTGETGADKEIIIKISSPEARSHLRKKGKAGGLLWMNVGELEFNPVSDVYFIYSTEDTDKILNESEQDRYAIGYEALYRLVEISPVDNEADRKKWLKEFIKFKEKDKIYAIFTDKIMTETIGNKKTYDLTIDWPYQAPPQEYTVNVYAVKDGLVREQTEHALVVEKVGALKFLSNMAFNNAAIYGIVSIIIGLTMGFIVSVIFRKGGRGH